MNNAEASFCVMPRVRERQGRWRQMVGGQRQTVLPSHIRGVMGRSGEERGRWGEEGRKRRAGERK